MIFVNTFFKEGVKNDPGIQRRNWYILYELLEKSVVRVIRDWIHCIRVPAE